MFVLNREFSNVDKKYLLRLNVSPASKKIALFLDLTIERKKRGKEGRKQDGNLGGKMSVVDFTIQA